jgi:hypothetical protein
MPDQPTSASAQAATNPAGERTRPRRRFHIGRGDGQVPGRPAFEDLSGTALELANARVAEVDGEEVRVSRSLVGRLRGRRVDVRQSGAALALGREVHVHQGGGGILAGGRLIVEQGGGQWLVGGLVQARQVFAVAVVAGKIEGQVRCLFDTRGAFAFGAGVALMTGLLRLVLRRSK